MPQIDLQVDAAPGQIVLAFECNAAQRFAGNRTTFGPLLMLPLQLMQHFPPQKRALPLLVGGVLRWNQENDGISIASQPWLFNQSSLSISLSDGQVGRIEQQRGGGQAIFQLDLRALALLDGALTLVSSIHSALLVVPRDEWIRILAMMGQGLRRLIELPPPPNGLGGLWDAAAGRIEAGAACLAIGKAGVALAEIRIGTERLLEAIGQSIGRPRKGGLKPSVDAITAELRRRHIVRSGDPYEVLARAVELTAEIFAFGSEPAHTSFDSSDRRDAELALGLATTLYAYAAQFRNALQHASSEIAAEAGE